jgi:uncharacterized protein YgiM (DUF1202 family)
MYRVYMQEKIMIGWKKTNIYKWKHGKTNVKMLVLTWKRGGGAKGGGGQKGAVMTQSLYAHMNKGNKK